MEAESGAERGTLIWIKSKTDVHAAAQVNRACDRGMPAETTPISPPNPLLLNAYSALEFLNLHDL